MNQPVKKVTRIIIILAALITVLALVLFSSSNKFEAVLTPTPAEGLFEQAYLTTSKSGSVLTYSLKTTLGLEPHSVFISEGTAEGNQGVFLKRNGNDNLLNFTEKTVAVLAASDFHNGSIEVNVKGVVSTRTSLINQYISRGFVGICFRINENVSAFECLYLRPENGISEDPIRRKHAVQYISVPEWGFSRLRDEAPGQYENSAPIMPDTWHKVRIEIQDNQAKLFIDDHLEPTLEISDLKLGPDRSGRVGLWVGIGAEAFFKNLVITKTD
jgi:hypothetical protein